MSGSSSHRSLNSPIPWSLIFSLWIEASEVLLDYDQRLDNHLDCLLSIGQTLPAPLNFNPQSITSTSSPTGFATTTRFAARPQTVGCGNLVEQPFFCHFVRSQHASEPTQKTVGTAFQHLIASLNRGFDAEKLKQFLRKAADHKGILLRYIDPCWWKNQLTCSSRNKHSSSRVITWLLGSLWYSSNLVISYYELTQVRLWISGKIINGKDFKLWSYSRTLATQLFKNKRHLFVDIPKQAFP